MTRRRFNGSERVALLLASGGRCSACGVDLEPGWHADHVQPFSAGGATDVTNGQALCPACNLAKGARVTELREWQRFALDLFLARTDDFLAVATPGAGKTTFALTAAQRLMERHEVARIVVVVPTAHLRTQWASAAARIGIRLDHLFANGAGVLARDFDGVVTTYDSVAAQPHLWRKLSSDSATMVILDEVHHASEDRTWGAKLRTAFESSARRLLLSGTPFRSDGTAIPFITYDDAGRCVPSVNYDYGSALRDRTVVRPVEFLALDGPVRWREAGAVVSAALADTNEATLARALNTALEPGGEWIGSVLKRADQELTRQRSEVPDAGGLVVASDQRNARHYAAILERLCGEVPTVAISDEPEASGKISQFAGSSSRWIVAVQMVSEGVDIPRLAVGVYASRVRTEMFFRQVVGRFVRMRGKEDDTCATLLIPSIQPLLSYAAAIEKTVVRVLSDDEQRLRAEAKEDDAPRALQFDLVQPIDSGVAVHHSTILAGDSFSEQELQRARTIHEAAGMSNSVPYAQVARVLRLGGAGKVVGTATVEAPQVDTRPLGEQKASLRRHIKSRVGRLAHLTDRPHAHIHGDLNRLCRDTATTATAETLVRRLGILDEWIAEEGGR